MARILIAEDSENQRWYLQHLLAQNGHEVAVAADGQTALVLYRERIGSFDLVITDGIMPLMDGWELARQIRTIAPDQKILLRSGYKSDYLPAYLSAAIGKPHTDEELVAVIAELLASR